MINHAPELPARSRYGITEAARLMECDPRTLRVYLRHFNVVGLRNKVNGREEFWGHQLNNLWARMV